MKLFWGSIFSLVLICLAIDGHPGGKYEHQEATIVKLKNNINAMEGLLSRQERRLAVGFEYLQTKVASMNKMADQAERNFRENHRSDINCTMPPPPPNGHMLGVHYDTNGAVVPLTREIYFVCEEGFHLRGSEVRSCQGNGTWSGEVTSCEDITARLRSCAKLDCLNGGSCVTGGLSSAHYRCKCEPGFYGKRCQKKRLKLNGGVKKCTNLGDNRHCSCDNGYKKGSNNALCFDVDECADISVPQTDVIPGNLDGLTKRDALLRHNSRLCRHQCVNTMGSYKCICPLGYIVDVTNKHECTDIDECALGTHSCHDGQRCFNTGGSYQCVSVTCPKNYKKISNFMCQRRKCVTKDRKCRREPVTYTFNFIDLPSNVRLPTDVFQLQADEGSSVNFNKFSVGAGNELGTFRAKKVDALHGTLVMTKQLENVTSWQVDFEVREMTSGKRRFLIGRYVYRILIFLSPFDF